MNTTPTSGGGMSKKAIVATHIFTALAAMILATAILKGDFTVAMSAIAQAAIELPFIAAILLAAIGFGGAILLAAKLISKPTTASAMDENSPSALLSAATACAVGFWFLATLMLGIGTFFKGAMNSTIWWAIIAVGAAIEIAIAYRFMRKAPTSAMPEKLRLTSLVWTAVFAAAVGVWIGGATCPAGFAGLAEGDFYDVMEYHMQVPREYYIAGQITQLQHNVYSHYPLGMEMLFLIAMCLRGGAYEAMYLCNMIPGLFLMVGAAGLFGGLGGRKLAGRTAAVLLVTAPAAAYLAWQPMVELGGVCYLALAMAWLAVWMRTFQLRTAIIIGIMLGAACGTKYLAVGFVLAPIILVMIIAAIRKPARLVGVVAAAIVAVAIFSPWLIRNYCYTNNPVFPLATKIFGKGHWTDQCNQRWVDGHCAENKPPVPKPETWTEKPQPSRAKLFWDNFAASEFYGVTVITVILVGLLAAVANLFILKRRFDALTLAALLIFACQLAIWILVTRGMPWRFIVTAIVPISILLAMIHQGAVDASASVKDQSPMAESKWLWIITLVAMVAIVTSNFYHSANIFASQCYSGPPISAQEIIAQCQPYKSAAELKGGKILLVGDAKAFYYPPGTIYSTVFDRHLLEELAGKFKYASQINEQLRRDGVRYILKDEMEISRLKNTYGFSPTVLEVMGWQPSDSIKQRPVPAENIPTIYELN